MLSIERILVDGTLLSLVISAIILVSLWVNPRIWINDYPAEIRQNTAPLTANESRQRTLFTILFFAAFVVVPYLSTRAFAEMQGDGMAFGSLFLHTFLVLSLFNLFDAVVIDWLFLGILHPKFAFIPEAWAKTDYLLDARKGITDWLKGVVFCAVGGLSIAGILMLTMG